jgi:hypothetical protein
MHMREDMRSQRCGLIVMQLHGRRGNLGYLRNNGLLCGPRRTTGFDLWCAAGVTAADMRGTLVRAGTQRVARHESAEHQQDKREC